MTIVERLFCRSVIGSGDEGPRILAYLGATPGIFVEVGANHPIVASQTYHLEHAGWTGVLIEPLGDCAERLRASRRAQVFEAAAGPPEDDGKDRPLLLAGPLSTLLPETVEGRGALRETRHVRVRTLDSMLREAGIRHVDFLCPRESLMCLKPSKSRNSTAHFLA